MPPINGETSSAVFEVEPLEVGTVGSRFVQVLSDRTSQESSGAAGAVIEVSDVTATEAARRTAEETERRLERAATVNRHLHDANDEVTALVAQLRLANQAMLQSSEEAQAGREEVETLNEEAQATNEELETLNEELTASVDELRTANDELAARTDGPAPPDRRTRRAAKAPRRGAQPARIRPFESRRRRPRRRSWRTDDRHEHGLRPSVRRSWRRLRAGRSCRAADPAGRLAPAAGRPRRTVPDGVRRERSQTGPGAGSRPSREPLTTKDRTWGGVVAIRDVSERTMRLSLERLMASAGHELKTPTAAIHNYLQLVERHLASGDVEGAAAYASRGMEQSQRLSTLIERLLDVSRIQTGQMELEFEAVDLAAVVGSAVDVAKVLPAAPPIQVTGRRRPILVWADPARLEQVVVNLLINAIEHAPETATIDIAVSTEDHHAKVVVRDHGPGIAATDIKTIFEPYKRLGEPQARAGLGLGLFVAREIVTAHGGRISATSRQRDGTVMTVRLPLAGRATEATEGAEPAEAAETAEGGRPRGGRGGSAARGSGRVA